MPRWFKRFVEDFTGRGEGFKALRECHEREIRMLSNMLLLAQQGVRFDEEDVGLRGNVESRRRWLERRESWRVSIATSFIAPVIVMLTSLTPFGFNSLWFRTLLGVLAMIPLALAWSGDLNRRVITEYAEQAQERIYLGYRILSYLPTPARRLDVQ